MPSNRLYWNNVAAPDFSSANQMYDRAGIMIGRASNILNNAFQAYQKDQQQRADNLIAQRAAAIQDTDAYRQALASGQLMEGTNGYASSQMLQNLQRGVSDRISNDASLEQLATSRENQEYLRLGRETLQAASPYLTAINTAANKGDFTSARRAYDDLLKVAQQNGWRMDILHPYLPDIASEELSDATRRAQLASLARSGKLQEAQARANSIYQQMDTDPLKKSQTSMTEKWKPILSTLDSDTYMALQAINGFQNQFGYISGAPLLSSASTGSAQLQDQSNTLLDSSRKAFEDTNKRIASAYDDYAKGLAKWRAEQEQRSKDSQYRGTLWGDPIAIGGTKLDISEESFRRSDEGKKLWDSIQKANVEQLENHNRYTRLNNVLGMSAEDLTLFGNAERQRLNDEFTRQATATGVDLISNAENYRRLGNSQEVVKSVLSALGMEDNPTNRSSIDNQIRSITKELGGNTTFYDVAAAFVAGSSGRSDLGRWLHSIDPTGNTYNRNYSNNKELVKDLAKYLSGTGRQLAISFNTQLARIADTFDNPTKELIAAIEANRKDTDIANTANLSPTERNFILRNRDNRLKTYRDNLVSKILEFEANR